MKTCRLLTVSLIAMLLACDTALAQSAPRSSRTSRSAVAGNRFPGGNDDSLVMPGLNGPAFYLEGGFACMRTKMNSRWDYGENNNFFGPSLAFGLRVKNKGEMHKFQIETSILAASHKDSFEGTLFDDGFGNTKDGRYDYHATYKARLLLFTYSYCIPLTSNHRWELRVSPTAGVYSLKMHVRDDWIFWSDSSTETDSYSSRAGTGAVGLGLGVACHINKSFYLDFGYRLMHITPMNLGEAGEVRSQTTHTLALSAGWKF